MLRMLAGLGGRSRAVPGGLRLAGSARVISRARAKEHGLAVSERGRIPASVAEQYQAANGR